MGEAEERAAALVRTKSLTQQKTLRRSHQKAFEQRLETLRAEFEVEDAELERLIVEEALRGDVALGDKVRMARSRQAFVARPARRNGAR